MKDIALLGIMTPWASFAFAQPCTPAYFTYPNICLSSGTLSVDFVSAINALFYSLSPGITISDWGTIDLAASNPGTYTIAFLVLNSCQNL